MAIALCRSMAFQHTGAEPGLKLKGPLAGHMIFVGPGSVPAYAVDSMRFIEKHNFDQIQAYQLGWSLLGPPVMTVYCYVFGDVMLDTAQAHMKKEVLEIARAHRIQSVYLTHYHEDHSGNACAIKKEMNAHIYGHPITKIKLSVAFKILPYQNYIWGKATPSNIKIVPQRIETILGEMTPVHTPGHSEDHTVYFIKDAGILFSGDIYLADKIKYFRADENMGSQIASLKKILSLDFHTLLCSHCPKREAGKEHLKRKLDFLENLYGNIIVLWEKGMSGKQIFHALNLKEHYFAKYFCFGDVSMMNGVRSAIRHYHSAKEKDGPYGLLKQRKETTRV